MSGPTPPGFDLNDLFSHREAWRSAIVAMLEAPGITDADESYWRHELVVFDRTFSIFGGGEGSVTEWTKWTGGSCPVFGTLNVDYRERNGTEHTAPAAALVWEHEGDGGDIVAYRISHEQPQG